MARPQKEGLDYFPLNVEPDDKFEDIETEFGIVGFAVIIKLFQRIYGQHGYYIMMTEREQKRFSKKLNVDNNEVNAIIMYALTVKLFDRNLFERYGVLTSRGIQKRYLEAAARRKNIELEGAILLVDVSNMEKVSVINVDINPINDDIMYASCSHDVDKSTQSKVKESKVEDSKGNESGSSVQSATVLSENENGMSGYIHKATKRELTIKEFNCLSQLKDWGVLVYKVGDEPDGSD